MNTINDIKINTMLTELTPEEVASISGGGWIGRAIGRAIGSVSMGGFGGVVGAVVGDAIADEISS